MALKHAIDDATTAQKLTVYDLWTQDGDGLSYDQFEAMAHCENGKVRIPWAGRFMEITPDGQAMVI